MLLVTDAADKHNPVDLSHASYSGQTDTGIAEKAATTGRAESLGA